MMMFQKLFQWQLQKTNYAFFTGSDWCGWCMRLKREVFNLPDFKIWSDENVVLVELDFEKKETFRKHHETK